ncbi:MAG: hypothetical protein WCV90_00140 [Candidatus Woesearchaeota archaeon]|jgi:hypothetical protein
MNPRDVLREGTYRFIEEMNILTDLALSARKVSNELKQMLEEGIITNEGIDAALTKAAIGWGKMDYDYLTRDYTAISHIRIPAIDRIWGGWYLKPVKRTFHRYADHAISPETLVFAFDQGAITPKQMQALHYAHGETAETYPGLYRDHNLIPGLREKLLNPDDLLERVMASSLDSCGLGHCDCWEHH